MSGDLREALEKAIGTSDKDDEAATSAAAAESTEDAKDTQVENTESTETTEENTETTEATTKETEQSTEQETEQPEVAEVADEQREKASSLPPPQAWKAPLKAKWASLDKDIQAEIVRRERDILREFGNNATARKTFNELSQVVRPYEARLRALNLDPVQAFSELLKADYLLSNSQPRTKAQYIAKMIQSYGVDIRELDSVLAGETTEPTPEQRIDQILAQKLAPLQQLVNQQQAAAQAEQARQQAATAAMVNQMADDVARFPHFDDLRVDMADLIDSAARRGKTLTLEEAYNRAEQIVYGTASKEARQKQTRRALDAAASVSGAPTGLPAKSGSTDSLRATVERAFSSAGRR